MLKKVFKTGSGTSKASSRDKPADYDVMIRMLLVGDAGKRVKLQIWDTAGSFRYQGNPAGEFRGVQAVILVYSISDRRSFHSIRHWLQEVRAHAIPQVNKILVGTKCDRTDRMVSEEEGRKLAEEAGCLFMEASAQTAENVQAVFTTVAGEALHRILKEYGKQ
ncbi:hypothetical protein GPECTOR_62g923 [Gonium pectorale]|uniref:Uncharacterized protein n=1 Tax=Gonium pectorale TaxID=33097 RepID=A0A150G4Q4_GONPE|nr:hypothetical protein GPECTOR_62g923 [Gonium pectorale]|eukprot:KXZ44808.1 hypothetical protein GPECTOR_62g923 [Gonium pectorale]